MHLSKKPKILFFDVETSPNEGFYWNKQYDTNIIKRTRDAEMLCFAYKWQDKKRLHGASQATAGDEKRMINLLHPVFNEMDYLVGHNVNKFDRRWSNTVFGRSGLTQPAPYKIIDTMTIMKKHFYLPSYSMEESAKFFDIDTRKKKIGWEVWEACIEDKDKEAYAILLDYNKQDIRVLEALYEKLVEGGWIADPSLEVILDRPEKCDKCGSERLKSHGYQHLKTHSNRRFICLSCGRVSSVRV